MSHYLIIVMLAMSSNAFHNHQRGHIQCRGVTTMSASLQDAGQITFLIDDLNKESKQYYSYFTDKPINKAVSWRDALEHASEKLSWENVNKNDISSPLKMQVIGLSELLSDSKREILSEIVIMIGNLDINMDLVNKKQVFLTFDCSNKFQGMQRIGQFNPRDDNNMISKISMKVDEMLKNDRHVDRVVYSTIREIWDRRSIDDLLFVVMILIDRYSQTSIKSVRSVTSTEGTSMPQLYCMCQNCGKEMIECFSDPTCRKALACLNSCKGNDQVCSYRCITSYESPAFQKFAFCILQKNNCMGNEADAPIYPDPSPLQTFRGLTLSHETAEEIFIGWLKPQDGDFRPLISDALNYRDWSWKVVAGKNAAYDFFNCQHQIFYRQKSYFWYDPVFKVETLDNKEVWRRRHYRVKRGNIPGTFFFSVLDNGVKSEEFWRIVEAADDLSWAVFYYSGAAKAAGTSYSGCIVATKDGEWPGIGMYESDSNYSKLSAAMIAAGNTKMWELYEVENDCCDLSSEKNRAGQPPLGYRNN